MLFNNAQRGDREAFGRLIAGQEDQLAGHVRLRLGASLRERLEVEDVLQESYTRALRPIKQFRWQGPAALQGWLRRIAENVILELAKKHRRDQVIYLEGDVASTDPTPSRQMRREERFDRFEAAVRSLAPEYREVVRLSRVQGLPTRKIAERMNRSPKAVSHLLSRAMKKLRETLEESESLGLPARRFDDRGPGDG